MFPLCVFPYLGYVVKIIERAVNFTSSSRLLCTHCGKNLASQPERNIN